VYQPSATSYTKADVCLGDTTTLGIANKTENAANFAWYVDYFTLLGNSQALNIISANSNSGGPFMISWLDTGRHVIQLNSTTEEGCASLPSFDTVFVHTPPDASFSFKYSSSSLCLEDSVYFTANTEDYNNSFTWSPAHSFSNVNKPEAWGQLEQTQSIITLTVTDPFGCTASTSHELDPGTCCTVAFPNAFTPNGDGHNDKFRPLFTGYHNFHVFRIQNRWGQTVFESTNSNMQWDGTFSGVPQDMGVYFYYIKYDCGGQTIEESGDVTLIR
jgi:gliding motility-associated-like protein